MTPPTTAALVARLRELHAKATEGTLDVHRYDQDGGSIAWQVQSDHRGTVLCQHDDRDSKRARWDAELHAEMRNALPALLDLLSGPPAESFEQAWGRMKARGYQYGEDALEQVRFGWELAHGYEGNDAPPAATLLVEVDRLRAHTERLERELAEVRRERLLLARALDVNSVPATERDIDDAEKLARSIVAADGEKHG